MPEKTPRISLVIPAYNEARYLRACLDAAFAQELPFFEVIVVDNGSTDATAQLAAQYGGVRLLHEPKRGIVYARNRGFDAARGDTIARIDADTVLPPDWSAHIAAFYSDRSHAATAWTSSGIFTDAPASRLVSAGYRLVTVYINMWLTGYPALWGSSMALPAGMWQRVKRTTCMGNGFHEDLDLATHIHLSGYRIHWDKKVQVEAQLRHAWVSRRELWEYLQWWPRTLRRHGQKTWVLCWLGGALAMFGATLVLQLIRRSPKPLESAQLPSALET